MTSMQIAEVTGKRHSDVLRAIRNMEAAWEKINKRKFALNLKATDLGDGKQRKDPYYELTKTECLYIATKFNDEARARLILRWEELENELLTTPRHPEEAEILPPPIDNGHVINGLVECVEGKAVTTSRRLARVLGREHSSILETIRNNRHQRAFKYGNFSTRGYTSARFGHGYEYLITRKGLEALAGVMRYNAKEKIAEAYAGAWDASPTKKALPAAETPALPALVDEAQTNCGTDDEITYTPGQQKYIDWLEGYNEKLGDDLAKARDTLRFYAESYRQEKHSRMRAEETAGYWQDLYHDVTWRVANGSEGTLEGRLKAHNEFRSRIFQKMKP